MDPEFGFMDHLMPPMMRIHSQILKISKRDPDTPTLNEAIAGTYKAGFVQART